MSKSNAMGNLSAAERRELAEALQELDHPALVDLVITLVRRDPAAGSVVRGRVDVDSAPDVRDAESREIVERVSTALSARGYVDPRRTRTVAAKAQEVLTWLADMLDTDAPDQARPGLLRALTRLRKISESANDSQGRLNEAMVRSVDLYARSCREGTPDQRVLARWLAKFRRTSPGWPDTPLELFADALGEQGLRTYRAAVLKWMGSPTDDSDLNQARDAMLEIHELEGDLDAAIEILSGPPYVRYAAIVDRLQEAGRTEEATAWLDRAVATNNVGHASGDLRVAPQAAAELFMAAGRDGDALLVLRADFTKIARPDSWRALLDLGARLGRESEERSWALATAAAAADRVHGTGAALIEIALSEDRLDDAWIAAERFGTGLQWEQLVAASAEERPIDTAGLYRARVESVLTTVDSRYYEWVGDVLLTVRDLYAAGGDDDTFRRYLMKFREDYGQRPALMKALTRRRL